MNITFEIYERIQQRALKLCCGNNLLESLNCGIMTQQHITDFATYELKKGKFKPADAGQLNFYLNVLDDKIKLQQENSSIGIVLCKEKNNTVVEFAIKSFDKAMGVATYKTSKQTPVQMKGILPDTDELGKLLE